MIEACCTHSLVNSGATGPNLTKFLYNVEKLLSFNHLKSIHSGTPACHMRVGSANFANLATKLVYMAMSLEISQNE